MIHGSRPKPFLPSAPPATLPVSDKTRWLYSYLTSRLGPKGGCLGPRKKQSLSAIGCFAAPLAWPIGSFLLNILRRYLSCQWFSLSASLPYQPEIRRMKASALRQLSLLRHISETWGALGWCIFGSFPPKNCKSASAMSFHNARVALMWFSRCMSESKSVLDCCPGGTASPPLKCRMFRNTPLGVGVF